MASGRMEAANGRASVEPVVLPAPLLARRTRRVPPVEDDRIVAAVFTGSYCMLTMLTLYGQWTNERSVFSRFRFRRAGVVAG